MSEIYKWSVIGHKPPIKDEYFLGYIDTVYKDRYNVVRKLAIILCGRRGYHLKRLIKGDVLLYHPTIPINDNNKIVEEKVWHI